MTDLLARLAQRPPKPPKFEETAWSREFWESHVEFRAKRRAEFDRDLALDALAAVLNCNAGACGNPMLCPTRCKADKEAGTILRELRAGRGEGGGL